MSDSQHLITTQMHAVNTAAEQGGYGPVPPSVTLLEAALWWASRGLAVFPCQAGGKRPVPIHGFKEAVTDEHRIRSWWSGRPLNIGVATGYPGPDVLDVDVRPGGSGFAAFNRLKQAGLLAGAHRIVRTPSGGLHVYFAGSAQRCGSVKEQRLDFKARGGYVLVPPSQVGGRPYQMVDDRPPTGAVLDWEACKKLLCPPRPVPVRTGYRRGPGSAKRLVKWLKGEAEGNRNDGLFWAACRAAEAGDQDALAKLAGTAVRAGLSEEETARTVASAVRRTSSGR
jgi:hypothetical protein